MELPNLRATKHRSSYLTKAVTLRKPDDRKLFIIVVDEMDDILSDSAARRTMSSVLSCRPARKHKDSIPSDETWNLGFIFQAYVLLLTVVRQRNQNVEARRGD